MVSFIWKVWVANNLGQTDIRLSCILGDLQSQHCPDESEKAGSDSEFLQVGHSLFLGDLVPLGVQSTPNSHLYFSHVGSRPRYRWLASSPHKPIIHNLSRLLQGAQDSPIWFPPLTFPARPGCYIFLTPLSLSQSPRQVWGTFLPGCVIWCLTSGMQEPGALWMGVQCCHSPPLQGISQAHTFPKCRRLQKGHVSSSGKRDLRGVWTIKTFFSNLLVPQKMLEKYALIGWYSSRMTKACCLDICSIKLRKTTLFFKLRFPPSPIAPFFFLFLLPWCPSFPL